MENKFDLEDFRNDDVISTESQMIKISKFRQEFKEILGDFDVANIIQNKLKAKGVTLTLSSPATRLSPVVNGLKDGIDVEVLRIGDKGWQQGKVKVRFSLEFYPDEPEVEDTPTSNQSELSLDDIHRTMRKNSQQYN